jgi:hypothetical protein
MARRKNKPESVREKSRLAERLRAVRVELFGERGGSEMARRLGLPVRTWYNYESGVTVPAEVLLRFVELTTVETHWLLYGRGPKFRTSTPVGDDPADAVRDLLRTALRRLEDREATARHGGMTETLLVPVDESSEERSGPNGQGGPHYVASPPGWSDPGECPRCLRVDDDAMAPVLAEGASVAYSDAEPDLATLDGKLVVAWVGGRPLVRRFELAGRYAVLRAENPQAEPATVLVDLQGPAAERRIRRVLWTSTPH